MRACSQCGTPNDDARAVCGVCGAPLPAQAAPRAAAPSPQQTMLGMPAMAPPSDLARTLVGTADPASAAYSAPATLPSPGAGQAGMQRTMLGIAPIAPQAAPPVAPPAGNPGAMKTMLGIAPLSSAAGAPSAHPASVVPGSTTLPSHGPGATGPSAPAPQGAVAPPASQAAPSSALASNMKTVLGVAMPGIAPLNPGVAKAPPTPAYVPAPAPYSAPVGPTDDDLSVLPSRRKGTIHVVAILAIGGAVMLGLAAVAFALFWRSPKPLQASLVADGEGKESLEIQCEGCADGATIAAGTARAVVRDRRATLALSKPLAVGDNELSLTIERGDGRTDDVTIVVPVDYRIRADVSALSEEPPKLRLTVEATKGTAVAVDGKPVALDASGRGSYDLDVSQALTGPSAEGGRIERKVPYTVTPPEGAAATGEVAIGLPIAQLRVDAPGTGIVVEAPNFMLAGRTQKGGNVAVAGRPITVDPSGRFAQLMNVSSEGETTITVRASLADHAPRLVPIRVKRVKSLTEEAVEFRKKATDSYAGIATDIDSKQGWAVALEGKVVEARNDDHSTVVLLDVARGCAEAPCVARLVHGARLSLQKGDRISAFGKITKPVEGLSAGKQVPEVAVEFVLAGAGK